MALVLCHECLNWVEATEGWCDHCAAVVRVEEPDPPVEELAERIGRVVRLLGEVRLKRRKLPSVGMLYATEKGLLFVPHVRESPPRREPLDREARGRLLLWTLFTSLVPLVGVFTSVSGLPERRPSRRRRWRPRPLGLIHSPAPAQVLLSDPGVVFVRADLVQSVERRRSWWVVHRVRGSTFRFRPLGRKREFRRRWDEAMNLPAWSQTFRHA